MSFVPEACMAYTEVYKTVRLEMGFAVMIGVAIGIAAAWLHNK